VGAVVVSGVVAPGGAAGVEGPLVGAVLVSGVVAPRVAAGADGPQVGADIELAAWLTVITSSRFPSHRSAQSANCQ
jgi:hypothetical protein